MVVPVFASLSPMKTLAPEVPPAKPRKVKKALGVVPVAKTNAPLLFCPPMTRVSVFSRFAPLPKVIVGTRVPFPGPGVLPTITCEAVIAFAEFERIKLPFAAPGLVALWPMTICPTSMVTEDAAEKLAVPLVVPETVPALAERNPTSTKSSPLPSPMFTAPASTVSVPVLAAVPL
jgi:hypothetical protein